MIVTFKDVEDIEYVVNTSKLMLLEVRGEHYAELETHANAKAISARTYKHLKELMLSSNERNYT